LSAESAGDEVIHFILLAGRDKDFFGRAALDFLDDALGLATGGEHGGGDGQQGGGDLFCFHSDVLN
jgi:hypothetical protein